MGWFLLLLNGDWALKRARAFAVRLDKTHPRDSGRRIDLAYRLAFGRLPPKLQVAATLALVEEQPYAEIADALNVPVGTVKSRVFRAIRALRKELAHMGFDHD